MSNQRNIIVCGLIPINSANPPDYQSNSIPLAVTANGHLWTDLSISSDGSFTLEGVANNSDSVTPSAGTRNLPCVSYTYAYDSTNGFFRRVNAVATNALNAASPSSSVHCMRVAGINLHFDGTFYARSYLASAANLALQSGEGAQIVQGPGEWSITHAPAANTTATISQAAVASKRHVCKGFSASLNAVAAIAAPILVTLRDGATGAGTILWQDRIMAPAGTTVRIDRTGLNIIGSVNTAMTLEFAAVPGATNFEVVNLSGITVS